MTDINQGADSGNGTVDAVAALVLITIVISSVLFWLSNQ